jgi:flagellar motility protein MotE (MotC chaperone)
MYISPHAIPEQPKGEKISPLVNQIITVKRTDPNANITTLEAEIDARVAHLYNLSEKEYSLILSELKPPDPFRITALNCYRDIAKGVLK